MRINQSTAASRCNRSDDNVAGRDSFDRHLQAARERQGDGHARPANHNPNAVTVKRGETLWDIAHRRGTTLKGLYEANPQFDPRRQDGVLHFDRRGHRGWDPDYIRPGDQIKLPSQPALRLHLGAHPHRRWDAGCKPDRPGPAQNTLKPSDHSGDPNSSSTPSNPIAGGPPNAPNNPNPSSPSNPSNPSTPAGAPQGSGPQHGLTPIVPIVPGSKVLKGGVGIEVAGRANAKPTLGGEPYVKGSLAIGPHWNINGKLKYTPRGKLNAAFDSTPEAATDPNAQPPEKPSLRERFKAALPEKIALDTGLVFNKEVEGGGSLEIKFDKGVKPTLSTYVSKKDPNNVLVDTAQLKLGKIDPKQVGSALVQGAPDSLAQSRADAEANGGRWSPLRQQVWNAVNGGEITFSGERAFINPQGPVSGFANFAGKTTLNDIGQGLEHPSATPKLTRFTGFAAGTAASFVGSGLTDELIGKNIGNQEVRRAVDGFGGAMTGLVADGVAQRAVPAAVSKIAPAVARLAAPIIPKVAPLVADAAPVLSKAGELASKIPLGATARVVGQVGRIGGPAGALVAGIPDGIDAYKAFQQEDTAGGWKAVGHGAVRVAGTAVGAALGQAFIPIPGVGAAVGAVAGGFVGDLVSKLF
jgi:LysM domain